MAGLTNENIRATQMYIDQERDRLRDLGLALGVSSDAEKWRDLIERAPGVRSLASTFDPDLNDIRERDMFWIYLQDKDNDIVSCVGYRLLETDDFIGEWVTTWRLFGDRVPHLDLHPLDYTDSLPEFSRRIAYGGGLWVHPDWRGHDVSPIVSRLGRVFALRHFCVDYCIAFIEGSLRKSRHTRQKRGWLNDRQLLLGKYPPRDEALSIEIFWEHRAETLAMCRERVELPDQFGVLQKAG